MAGSNMPLVRRSAYLFANAHGGPGAYSSPGTPFTYVEKMKSKSVVQALAASVLPMLAILLLLPIVRAIVRRLLPASGQGPSAAVRQAASFQLDAIGTTEDGGQVLVTMRGGEGYGFTALAMAEAGIALATERDSLPGVAIGPGFLTPATAFGPVLVRRLQAAGVELTVAGK